MPLRAWHSNFRFAKSTAPAPPSDPAQAWATGVVANGGTVSGGMLATAQTLVTSLKTANIWDQLDDFWLGRAENVTQFLTSFKLRRLATAINSPVFTAHDSMAFDGLTQLVNTNVTPSVDCLAMQATDERGFVWETTNVSANTASAVATSGANRSLQIKPRFGTNMAGQAQSTGLNFLLTVADSTGLSVINRGAGSSNVDGFKNGLKLATVAGGAPILALPFDPFCIAAQSVSGTASQFRAAHVSLAGLGRSLATPPDAAELAFYNAFNAYMGAALLLREGPEPEPFEGEPMVLVLDAVLADAVRGPSATPGHALEPRPLANGDYILPESVLSDPVHADAAELLADCVIVPASTYSELFE